MSRSSVPRMSVVCWLFFGQYSERTDASFAPSERSCLVSCVAERRQNGAKVSVRAAGLLVSTSVDAAGQRGRRRRYLQWRYDADISHRPTAVASSTLPQSSSRQTSSTTVAHIVVVVSGLRPMTHEPNSPSKLLVPKSRNRNLEAIAHVVFCPSFCYQTNLVPECTTD